MQSSAKWVNSCNLPHHQSVGDVFSGGRLDSLVSNPLGRSIDEVRETHCLIDHAVHFLPITSDVDVPAIFADYYFLEALLRYRARRNGD